MILFTSFLHLVTHCRNSLNPFPVKSRGRIRNFMFRRKFAKCVCIDICLSTKKNEAFLRDMKRFIDTK